MLPKAKSIPYTLRAMPFSYKIKSVSRQEKHSQLHSKSAKQASLPITQYLMPDPYLSAFFLKRFNI